MALIFYDKQTGIVRRSVFDETKNEAELEKAHLPQADEAFFHLDLKFSGMDNFDLAYIQSKVPHG